MNLRIDLTPADRACDDCGEKAHRALDAMLSAELGKGLAKGGEVDALQELEAIVQRGVDERLKRLVKSVTRAH
jgi:hypothetical protein